MINPWDDDQFCWEMSMDIATQVDWQEAMDQEKVSPTAVHEHVKSRQRHRAVGVDEPPSECDEVYWIYAQRTNGKYPRATDRSGKWLVFAPADKIDALWTKIKRATERGFLGESSKVSTRLGNDGRDHVICVYTYDWKDRQDCLAIRECLRDLGIDWKISYKTDADTLAGRYAEKGQKIAKYYE